MSNDFTISDLRQRPDFCDTVADRICGRGGNRTVIRSTTSPPAFART